MAIICKKRTKVLGVFHACLTRSLKSDLGQETILEKNGRFRFRPPFLENAKIVRSNFRVMHKI